MIVPRHFRLRADQRGLRSKILEFVLAFGVEIHKAGARFVTIFERELPPELDKRLIERALGWVIVIADDGTPLTCYRRADAIRYIRRKTKVDLRKRARSREEVR